MKTKKKQKKSKKERDYYLDWESKPLPKSKDIIKDVKKAVEA